MIYRTYGNSLIATLVSLLGSGLLFGGLYLGYECISSGDDIMGAIALIAIGFGLTRVAANISHKKWIKTIEEKGLHIRAKDPVEGFEVCKAIYESNSNKKKALEYIRTLNPHAAQLIAQATGKK